MTFIPLKSFAEQFNKGLLYLVKQWFQISHTWDYTVVPFQK